jgi:hypothetical protein
MNNDKLVAGAYEPPTLLVLGSLSKLTQYCNKTWGSSDGFTFNNDPIVCTSA